MNDLGLELIVKSSTKNKMIPAFLLVRWVKWIQMESLVSNCEDGMHCVPTIWIIPKFWNKIK